MKKQLLLLVSILLPLISSCNVEPTEKPTVESSEEIYYIDGLASNLFVTEVPENVKCVYLEDSDSYIAYAIIYDKGVIYKDIDCIIPNVYDDGIHGLKRVKSFSSSFGEGGYYNKLIISEGIEVIKSGIGDNFAREVYYPSTTKKMGTLYAENPRNLTEEQRDVYNKSRSYYNGTISQFNQIEPIPPSGCVDSVPGKYEFICLDGVAHFYYYHLVDGCLQR